MVQVQVDGSWMVVTGTSFEMTVLGDGPHTFEVDAWDKEGNNVSEVVNFTVDTTAPTILEQLAERS